MAGVDIERLRVALDPLPPSSPAILQLDIVGRPIGDQVQFLVEQLDKAAIALFPSWLPGADSLERAGTLGTAAIRAIVQDAAAHTPAFGPFLLDLAERSLHKAERSNLPAEVRIAGLARVLADAYGRGSTILVIYVPAGLTKANEQSAVAAAEWVVHHSAMTVWLVGAPLQFIDRVLSVTIELPPDLPEYAEPAELMQGSARRVVAPHADPADSGVQLVVEVAVQGGLTSGLLFPPLVGRPRQDSAAEKALEQALAVHHWAAGRHWNHTYEWHVLGRPYRLDLFWPGDGLVVEVDGPEHRGPIKYADDRRRDVNLQLMGFAVLRFTNEQVLWDVQGVVTKIGQMLSHRRGIHTIVEMTENAKQ